MYESAVIGIPELSHSVSDMTLSGLVPSSNRLLDPSELAQQLNLPESEIINLAREGKLPCFQMQNGEYKFHKNAAKIFNDELLSSFFNSRPESKHTNATIHQQKEEPKREADFVIEKADCQQDVVAPNSVPSSQVKSIEENELSKEKTNTTAHDKLLATNDALSATSEKVQHYLKQTKYTRAQINKQQLNQLSKLKDEQQHIDYVKTYKLKIEKRSENGRYQLDIRGKSIFERELQQMFDVKSKRISLNTKDLNEAILKANQLITEKRKQQGFTQGVNGNGDITVNDAIKIAIRQNNNSEKKSTAEMNSKLGFLSYTFGEVKLGLINHHFIISLLDEMRHGGQSASTRHGYGVELRKMLEVAHKNELINSVPKIPSLKSNRRNLIELPWDSVWLPFIKSYSENSEEELFLQLIWHVGQRNTNVAEMKFSKIDLKNRVLHISSGEHKTNNMIDIPLSEEAIDIIDEIRLHHKNNGISSDKLFPNYKGIDKNRWQATIKEQGLNPELVIHHVRHYFITDLARNGVEKNTIKKASGLTSDDALNIYNHAGLTEKDKEEVNKRTGFIKSKNKKDKVSMHPHIEYVAGDVNFN